MSQRHIVNHHVADSISLREWSNLNLSREHYNHFPVRSQTKPTQSHTRMKAMILPTDILFKLFQFHNPRWELNKNFAQNREISKRKKIKALRDEMNACMPFVKYTAVSIRYFMNRRQKDLDMYRGTKPPPRNSLTYWICNRRECLQANSLQNSKCAVCGAANYTKSHLRFAQPNAAPRRTQCCAKTQAGTRCKNHTFGLVCKRHVKCRVNPPMYWM